MRATICTGRMCPPSKARSQCHRPTIQDPSSARSAGSPLLRARLADPRLVSYTVSDRKRKAAARADAADEAKLAPPPANDDRKPAILIIRRKSRFGRAEDLTVEEIQCRPLCHLIQLGERHHPLKDFIAGVPDTTDSSAVILDDTIPASGTS